VGVTEGTFESVSIGPGEATATEGAVDRIVGETGESTFESVSIGSGEVTATEGAVDRIGAGSLLSTAGLIGESFVEVVDGIELKSWVGTGESSAEVADGMVVERVGTGTGAGSLLIFASEEESGPGSMLPPRGGEAGCSAVVIFSNSSACVTPKLCEWERSRFAPAGTERVAWPGFHWSSECCREARMVPVSSAPT
jgi:hypothetical protein